METPAQQSTAFNILPAQMPTPPTATAPAAPGGADAAVNERAQKILQAISQLSQRKQMANTAVPMAIPPQEDANAARQIGMNTANPHGWGLQRFAGGVAANIKNAVAKQKQDQLLKAEGDWSYLQAAMSEMDAAKTSGDPNSEKAAQAKIDAVLGDPKKLKNMAKALNQDWLNPEKTTVYGEALKNVTAKSQQTDAAKGKAREGIMGIFKKLMSKNQQPSLTPEQQQQMAREIQAKAPMQQTAGTPADLEKESSALANVAYAQRQMREAPEKYQFMPIADPTDPTGVRQILVAADKTDPKKGYIEVKNDKGEVAAKGAKQFANEGKLEIVSGRPTGGVFHKGELIRPGDPRYTDKDKEAVNLGLNAYNLSEADKEKLARIRGGSYAFNKALYTPVAVVDAVTGESGFASQMELVRNPTKYLPPGEAEKIGAREAVHGSLNVNFAALEKSLKALPNGLDTETQAMIQQGLRSDDPGFFDTMMINKLKEHASDEVLQYLTNIKVMHEDILVLRTVGGMGQGSDMMRAAMIKTVPGAGTSSVKEGLMQIAGAKRTSEALFEGRPKTGPMGGKSGGGGKSAAPKVGDIIDGYKFNGGDPGKKENWTKQ